MGVPSMIGRGLRRLLKLVGALVFIVAVVVVVAGWRSFGRAAKGNRRARMERSPQWRGGHFENPQPLWNDLWGTAAAMLHGSADATPAIPPPTVATDPAVLRKPPAGGLRVTWFGHSSLLVEVDGHRVLTDPVWSERASPLDWVGPHRWVPPTLALAELPPIDAVVISHDHYDHLDRATIEALKDRPLTFFVPLGVAAHLVYWGVPEQKIVELDWWERGRVRDLEIVCTPSRHASGRQVLDKDATLWASYALVGPQHRVYFSGDTGLFPAMREIGERLGPFDLTMIEVGQYNRAWPDWHIGPEQAVRAHGLLRGRMMLPIHWGLFTLAFHGWTEPMERALVAAQPPAVPVLTPRIGQPIEPDPTATPTAKIDRWWPAIPWQRAEEHPIVSTKVN